MTDTEFGAIIAAIGALGAGLLELLRRALRVWSQLRREELEIRKEDAVRRREDNERSIDALVEQAKSNAQLVERLDALSEKVYATMEFRERTVYRP